MLKAGRETREDCNNLAHNKSNSHPIQYTKDPLQYKKNKKKEACSKNVYQFQDSICIIYLPVALHCLLQQPSRLISHQLHGYPVLKKR